MSGQTAVELLENQESDAGFFVYAGLLVWRGITTEDCGESENSSSQSDMPAMPCSDKGRALLFLEADN
uniref:Uncharacterized protein n=1 Tax=viral metagenome TaxID=1070528 RepID=A0A6M3J793_9ZZZZ